MSGVLYGGVPEEFVVLLWVVGSLLIGLSVTTSFVAMTEWADVLPERIDTLNKQHGWPGRSAMTSRGIVRAATVIFGVALLVMVLVVPVWSLLDSTITKGVIDRMLISAELMLFGGWVVYLAVRWDGARRRHKAVGGRDRKGSRPLSQ